MAVLSVRRIASPIRTIARLDDIVTILGATKLAFYPFLTSVGTEVFPYGEGNDGIVGTVSDEGGAVALEAEFDPIALPGGTQGYYFDSSANNHINTGGGADYSFEGDDAFSLGAWIYPTEALGTIRSVLSKYESTGNLEEYDFRFDASGNLVLELHDASASASEIGTGASNVIVPWRWNFVVATYDGDEVTPEVHLYRNASDTLSGGDTTQSGTYDEMEDTAATFKIGCRNTTGAPAQEFEGYIALPFVTGVELTQANVTALHSIGRGLLGL